MKKLLVIFLAFATLLTLSSCGPKESKKAEKVALENVYLTKKLPTPDGVDFYGIIMAGDKVYFNGSKEVQTTDDDGNEYTDWYDCFYVGNPDMSDIREAFSFKSEYGYNEEEGFDYGTYLNGYNPGKNGTLWLSFTEYKSWYDRDIDEYSYEEKSILKRLNPDGSFTDEIDVAKLLDSVEEFDGDTYSKYLGQVFETEDGKIIATVGNQYLLVIAGDGTFISLEKFPENKSPSDMAVIDSDTLRISAWDWSGSESKIEIIDYSFSKKEFKTVDSISTYYSVQMADDGTVYLNDYNVISKYDFEKKEFIPLLDFINSDINSDRLGQYYPAGNDEFYAFEYDNNYEDRNLLHLTPAAKGDVVEKYIITLAANALDSQLKSMIIDYNRSSKDYRITVKVYGWEEKDTEQFDLDLMSGNTPDIICIDSTLSLSKYATKGILTDMGTFLDKDSEISRDTLLPNILKACEEDGKIYSLPVTFALRSMMMKKSIVGDRTSLTFADIKEILASFPDAVYLRETDREQLMTGFLPVILEDFIDYENGKSNFSDGSFADFLEFAKTFPAKIDYENLYADFDDSDWEDYENAFKENRVLANTSYISIFETYDWMEEQFGEEIAYIGYPTSTGEPHALVFNTQFAIGSKSIYKEEAWNFMKMLLGKEYQTEYVWNFPVNKEAFNEKKEETITSIKSQYEKEDMEDDWYDDDFIMDDDMVVMPREEEVIEVEVNDGFIGMPSPMPIYPSEEGEDNTERLEKALQKLEHISNIASTTTRLARFDDPVLDIISSDVGAFFDSQKSIAETCKTIESRVNLYLAENS